MSERTFMLLEHTTITLVALVAGLFLGAVLHAFAGGAKTWRR